MHEHAQDLRPPLGARPASPPHVKQRSCVIQHRRDPSNYRPISLTCVACKIMESIIKDVVMTYLLENNLLSNCQLGFVSCRSVQLQLQPGGGGVDPIPCVSTHRISDPRSGPAQLLPPHVMRRCHPHGVRPQIPDH